MINIIMCGHGQLAIAMKDSIAMIYGDVDNIIAIDFKKDENREILVKKIADMINFDLDTLVIVDLFGGSPYNAAAELAFKSEKIELISGMSLPLCLEIVDNISDMSLSEITDYSVQIGKHCVQKFNKNIIKNEEEEDFI
ncbi:mannose/fructose/sorbose PTS transporter subunit IIA [Orbus sturtevantii]|uniref:PTS sugar transporter subunit IIA n=1 Tax=Orbus sturtevantii TaxID=3074109 RepID=UPI00370D4B09